MKPVISFRQSNIIAKVGGKAQEEGICLRLAWKWAACKSVGGDFQFDNANPQKSAEKFLRDTTDRGRLKKTWLNLIGDPYGTSYAIHKWSRKFTTAGKTVHSVTPGKESPAQSITEISNIRIDKPQGIVLNFSGYDKEGKAHGHSVALYGGKNPRFFDPNFGEYKFRSLKEVQNFIKINYPWATRFNTTTLSAQKDLRRQENELLKTLNNGEKLELKQEKKLNRLQKQISLLGKNDLELDSPALRTVKTVGKGVKESGRWTFFAGVAITAVGAGLCFSPLAPAGPILLAIGIPLIKIGGGAYMVGKISYPLTKLMASMRHGSKVFKNELKKCAKNSLTSSLKIAGTLAMSAGAIVVSPWLAAAIAGMSPAIISTGVASAAAAGLTLPTFASITSVAATAGLSFLGAMSSATGSILDRTFRKSKLLRDHYGRQAPYAPPSFQLDQKKRNIRGNSDNAHSLVYRPVSVSTSLPVSSYDESKRQIITDTPVRQTPSHESKGSVKKAKAPPPVTVNLSDLTVDQLEALQNKTFVVEKAGSVNTVIHKYGSQFAERIVCVNGIDCPADLRKDDKITLTINQNQKPKFEKAPERKASRNSLSVS